MNANISIDEFKSIVKASQSMRNASIKLNIPFSTFKKIAVSLDIYVPNQGGIGIDKTIHNTKTECIKILNGYCTTTISAYKLKNKLLKCNLIENKCYICGLSDIWNGKPLKLHLDHIDGNARNNIKENLRILCPNCHTQTPTYAGKKNKKITSHRVDYTKLQDLVTNHTPSTINELCKLLGITSSKGNYTKLNKELIKQKIKTSINLKCIECNCDITDRSKSGYCNKCSRVLQYKVSHPSKAKLIEELKTSNPYALGKKYGVSDNAIRHWMKGYDIPTKKSELKNYLENLPT